MTVTSPGYKTLPGHASSFAVAGDRYVAMDAHPINLLEEIDNLLAFFASWRE